MVRNATIVISGYKDTNFFCSDKSLIAIISFFYIFLLSFQIKKRTFVCYFAIRGK